MDWIALLPPHEDEAAAWGWQALRFTPRVARVEEAVLLEVSASCRLFGGAQALLEALLGDGAPGDGVRQEARQEGAVASTGPAQGQCPARVTWARASTSLVALALLRLRALGEPAPRRIPDDLPLPLLSAARSHAPLLARAGITTWGQLRALPRAQLARRFGAALLAAVDAAWGERPERYPWLALPEVFDARLELPALAGSAPELMAAAQRLLSQLQAWLRARQQGVQAFELEWTLDLRRLDGRPLPPHESLVVRTAQAVQAMDHLRRLTHEQLARVPMSAPASHLRLRSLETAPWQGASRSFLPEDNVEGERLHQLVERLSARLGADNVLVPLPQQDWRPERMQRWAPAVDHLTPQAKRGVPGGRQADQARKAGAEVGAGAGANLGHGLYPPWLLPQPLRLEVRDERPWHEGPLRLLTRRQRVETGWWEEGGAVVRDYCIARSEQAGLLWVFCEHGPGLAAPRWYLQGIYA